MSYSKTNFNFLQCSIRKEKKYFLPISAPIKLLPITQELSFYCAIIKTIIGCLLSTSILPGIVIRPLARALGDRELEEPRDVVGDRVEDDRQDELSGLDVVTLDEERRSHRQETLHRDGHRRVARTGQAYLCERPTQRYSKSLKSLQLTYFSFLSLTLAKISDGYVFICILHLIFFFIHQLELTIGSTSQI